MAIHSITLAWKLPWKIPWRSLIGYSPWGRRVGHDWVTSLSLSLIGRTDAEAENQVFWSPDANSRLIGKVPDAGKGWGQKEMRVSEDETAGWHHQCNGHELGLTLGDGEGQGSLACCSLWGRKESDTTGSLNNTTTKQTTIYLWMCVQSFNPVWLFATLWTVAHQVPLSMGFLRREYWSRLPFPPPGDLSDPGIEPVSLASPALAGRFFTTAPPAKSLLFI